MKSLFICMTVGLLAPAHQTTRHVLVLLKSAQSNAHREGGGRFVPPPPSIIEWNPSIPQWYIWVHKELQTIKRDLEHKLLPGYRHNVVQADFRWNREDDTRLTCMVRHCRLVAVRRTDQIWWRMTIVIGISGGNGGSGGEEERIASESELPSSFSSATLTR